MPCSNGIGRNNFMKLLRNILKGTLFLGSLVLAVFASSCRSKAFGGVTLKVMGYGDAKNFEGQSFERIVKDFESANPGIKVEYEILTDEAYHKKAKARIESGDIPHIAYMGADSRWGGVWQSAGQQIDNTSFFPSYIDSSLVPDFFGTGEKPYLPLGGPNYCSVVAVNMDLLARIGGKLPQSYDDMKYLARLCRLNGISLMTTHGAEGWTWGSCILSGILPRTTGDPSWIEKAVNGQVKFTDEGFIKALDVISSWVKDGILDKKSLQFIPANGIENFRKGNSLMFIGGQWLFGEANLGELSNSIKLIPIPPIENEEFCHNSVAAAWQVGYGITKEGASNLKTLDAAKKFIEFYNSEKESVLRLKNGLISTSIVKDFSLPNDIDPCIKEKVTLGSYDTTLVIDSFLTGPANFTLIAGLQDLVSGAIDSKTLASNVQKAFDAQ